MDLLLVRYVKGAAAGLLATAPMTGASGGGWRRFCRMTGGGSNWRTA